MISLNLFLKWKYNIRNKIVTKNQSIQIYSCIEASYQVRLTPKRVTRIIYHNIAPKLRNTSNLHCVCVADLAWGWPVSVSPLRRNPFAGAVRPAANVLTSMQLLVVARKLTWIASTKFTSKVVRYKRKLLGKYRTQYWNKERNRWESPVG